MRADGTAMWIASAGSALASSTVPGPGRPVRAMTPTSARVAASIASSTLADLPLVVQGDWTHPEQIPDARRVVVLSAERAGLVLAERLAETGAEVTIVSEGKLGPDVIPTFKWRHTSWIEEHGLEVLTQAHIDSIAADGVHVTWRDESRFLPADRVVVAGPRRPVNDLIRDLEFSVDELHSVGDAILPRSVANAVHEGFRIGNAI